MNGEEVMKTIRYNKLVRDRVPEIIIKSGKRPIVRRATGKELLEFLNEKLKEELQEYLESREIEELLDLTEVIYGILSVKGISINEFHNMREEKKRERGAFEEGAILLEVIGEN